MPLCRFKPSPWGALRLLALFLSTTTLLSAQTNIYLDITGVSDEGEVSDPAYQGQIALDSWTFKLDRAVSLSTSPPSPGKINYGSVRIMKRIDKSTPYFIGQLLKGQPINEMILTNTRPDGSGGVLEAMVLTLGQVFVTAIEPADQADGESSEVLLLEYVTMNVTYNYDDGSPGTETIEVLIDKNNP